MSSRPFLVLFIIAGIAVAGVAKDEIILEKKSEEPKKAPDDRKEVAPKTEESKIDTKEKPPEPKAAESPKEPIKAAEKLLQDAKIGTDAKSLIEFFRARTLSDDERMRLLTTIRRLGDDDFDTREQASEELKKAGLSALSILRAAGRSSNVEIARRVEICLQSIRQEEETARIIAAARLLAHHKSGEAVSTLFAYLPSAPDDEAIADGIRAALVSYSKAIGKADPLLKQALEDSDPIRRALAVQVIGEALPGEREAIRLRLTDGDAKVRYFAGSLLARSGDRSGLPALLTLLSDGPVELAFQVEDLLCQLLDSEEKPPATLSGNNPELRKKARQAWEGWINAKGEKLKLARLNEAEPLRGLTLIVEVDGGGVNGGRIWECGPDGKQRWELTNLGGPVDVQVLPGGRLLIPEYYNSRVTERDHEGKILWESPKLNGNTVSAQRLPNGNTLIATMQGVVEYTRDNRKVADFPAIGGTVYQAARHRNGNTFILAGNSLTEFDSDRKQVRSINVGTMSGWAGFDLLPNGNFLVACYSQNNRYAEIDGSGKTVWEHVTAAPTALNPTRVQRLRNGNTLVAGGNIMFVVEYDREKKEVWKVQTKGRPFGVRRY